MFDCCQPPPIFCRAHRKNSGGNWRGDDNQRWKKGQSAVWLIFLFFTPLAYKRRIPNPKVAQKSRAASPNRLRPVRNTWLCECAALCAQLVSVNVMNKTICLPPVARPSVHHPLGCAPIKGPLILGYTATLYKRPNIPSHFHSPRFSSQTQCHCDLGNANPCKFADNLHKNFVGLVTKTGSVMRMDVWF